jgi:Beta protein
VTFGANCYVPVLKIKRGEKKALRQVSMGLRSRIVPLLELVERQPDKSPSIDAHLDNAFKDLASSVSTYSRCFLDVREVAPDGPQVAASVFDRATAAGIVFSPVTGISRTVDVVAALAHRTHGLALRVTRAEFESGNLAGRIDSFLATHGLVPPDVDLIIDLGAVEDMIVDGIRALTDAFLTDVPHHEHWRTFTLSACAFPASMGVVDRHSHDFVERADWIAWRDLHGRRNELPRLPTFSDGAIQHPTGVEGFDPRIMQVSASVRYTLADHWLLIKGESTRSSPPSAQFPVLATRLVYGHLKPYFAGENHCAGCLGIKGAANGASGLGSPEAWRRLGTIHHISLTAQALAALP